MLTRRDLSSCSSSGRLLSQLSSLLNFVPLTSEADSTSPSSVCGGLVGKRGRVSELWWAGLVAPLGRSEASLFCEARRGIAVREVDGGSMVFVREAQVGGDGRAGQGPRERSCPILLGEDCARCQIMLPLERAAAESRQQLRRRRCEIGTAGDGVLVEGWMISGGRRAGRLDWAEKRNETRILSRGWPSLAVLRACWSSLVREGGG